MRTENRKFKLKLSGGRLGKEASCGQLFTNTKRCARKFHIFSYQSRRGGRWCKYGFEWKTVTWNQMNTPYFIYEIDQRKKLNTLGDFENQTPKHIDATHAFSKILQNFQNRIPRELNQNLYISRIGINHWFSSNFLN